MAEKRKNKKSQLGTGLEEIFGGNVTELLDDIQNNAKVDDGKRVNLNVNEIRTNPYQPRKDFDQEKLEELAQSIKEQGVFTPILVRKSTVGYELISGERRLRASQMIGNTTIPALIMDINEDQMMEIALLENIQREDLNVIEEANGYKKLMESLNYTQDQLAKRVGKSREHVANTLRLLRLPQEVQDYVAEGKLTMGQVRPLITLESSDDIISLANRIYKEGLSAREIEKLVKNIKNNVQPKTKEPFVPDNYTLAAQKNLQDKFGTKVRISQNSINISYGDVDDLNRILELLGIEEESLS